MRGILAAGLGLALAVNNAEPLAAQTDVNAARAETKAQLWALFHSYGEGLHFRFYRDDNDDFTIDAFYDRDLRYTPRFEIYISVSRQQTIEFRIYPQFFGHYINVDSATYSDSLMRQLLRDSDKSFFYWAVDDELDVFAGYRFTLESGFPEEAIKVVLRSIPLLDPTVGRLIPLWSPD